MPAPNDGGAVPLTAITVESKLRALTKVAVAVVDITGALRSVPLSMKPKSPAVSPTAGLYFPRC